MHRADFVEVPPRVEYSLTDLGRSLNRALEPLGLWGREHVLGKAVRDGAPGAPGPGETAGQSGNAGPDGRPAGQAGTRPERAEAVTGR